MTTFDLAAFSLTSNPSFSPRSSLQTFLFLNSKLFGVDRTLTGRCPGQTLVIHLYFTVLSLAA